MWLEGLFLDQVFNCMLQYSSGFSHKFDLRMPKETCKLIIPKPFADHGLCEIACTEQNRGLKLNEIQLLGFK